MKINLKQLLVTNVLIMVLCTDYGFAQSIAVEKIDPLSWTNIIRTILALVVVCCFAVISLKVIVRYLNISKSSPARNVPTRLNLEESLTIDRRNQIILLSLDRKQLYIATMTDGVLANLLPIEHEGRTSQRNLALVESVPEQQGNG